MRTLVITATLLSCISPARAQLENLRIWSNSGGGPEFLAKGMKRQERIDDLSKKIEANPGEVDLLIERADAYLESGNEEPALRDLEQAIAAAPDSPAVLVAAADRLGGIDPPRALVHVKRGLRNHPRDAPLLALRGRLNGLRGRSTEALADLDAALAIDPGDSRFLAIKGSVLLQAGRFPEAIDAFTRSLEITPSAWASFDRGFCYAMTGDFERAVADYSEAAALDPSLGDALCERGRAYQSLGRYQEARADYEACRSRKPDDPQASLQLAWLLATCPDDGVRSGQQALALARELCDPVTCRTTEPLNALAAAYAEVGDFATARGLQRRAVDLSHFAPDFHAASLRRLEQYEQKQPLREANHPLLVLDRPAARDAAGLTAEMALTAPARVLGETFLTIDTLLELCTIALGGGTIHTALDGKPLTITRDSAFDTRQMLLARRRVVIAAIEERGSVRLAATYDVETEGTCLDWGLLSEPMFVEQNGFQLMLTQGILRHRGVVVESAVVFRHDANTDVLLRGQVEDARIVFTVSGSGGIDGTAEGQCTAILSPAEPVGPRWAQAFVGRGIAHKRAGAYEQALADFDRAIALAPQSDFFMVRAMLLATCPLPRVRDGRAAIHAAEQARALSDGSQEHQTLGVLALAHAEAGDFERAVDLQRQAVARTPANQRPFEEAILRLFESGRPYHEGTPLDFDPE